MYQIKFSNGITLDNLTLNGNNYISENPILESGITSGLSQVRILSEDEDSEILFNAQIARLQYDEELGGYCLALIPGPNDIARLKQKLAETDYMAIKFAEGQLTEEEFAPIRAERASWRVQINKLEEESK